MHYYSSPEQIIKDELIQLKEEGYDLAEIEDSVIRELEANKALSWDDVKRIYLQYFCKLKIRSDFSYIEPDALDEIIAQCNYKKYDKPAMNDAELYDRIYGALLGRAAGCMLGKPVEGWTRQRIFEYLAKADEYRVTDYFPKVEEELENLLWDAIPCLRDELVRSVRDDDTDYPLNGLLTLEKYGKGFTAYDMGVMWLHHFPYAQVYTAEMAAYRNMMLGLKPPETATYLNPYREWIGAQIRADIFGWICPGDPAQAIKMSYQDAILSHTQNGVYGELWIAAMLSLAYIIHEPKELLLESLNYVPVKSRLYEALKRTVDIYDSGISFENAWQWVIDEYGHYDRVHTINNACFCVLALLYGEGDYSKTICLATECGWDTDCNAATVGSVVGIIEGAGKLPGKWISPLNDTMESIIPRHGIITFSEQAKRIAPLVD